MHRVGIRLSYRPAGGIHSLESIPGPHKHLKVRALGAYFVAYDSVTIWWNKFLVKTTF
jgi:hypothetical protein